MKKITTILSFAMLAVSLSSCLKDKGYDNNTYGINQSLEDNKVVNMPVTGTTFTIARTTTLATTAPFTVTLPIHLSAKEVASEDINVTVSVDNSRLVTYNAGVTSQFTLLPSDKFTISNGGVVKIPAGVRDATFTITYNSSTFANTGRWAIPVSITSIDKPGYIISGNQGYRILLVTVN